MYFKVDIILAKTKHTLFRGTKTSKTGEKGVFLVMFINFGKNGGKLRKKACKNMYLGSIFMAGKFVFRVCFESLFTRMISNLKYMSSALLHTCLPLIKT